MFASTLCSGDSVYIFHESSHRDLFSSYVHLIGLPYHNKMHCFTSAFLLNIVVIVFATPGHNIMHPPIHIEKTAVEKVESFKFLGVHITDKLKWSTHTDSVVKKAQQRLFNLWRLKKCGLSPKTMTNFYRCTIESILSDCITAWYDNCTALKLPALQETYSTRCQRKVK